MPKSTPHACALPSRPWPLLGVLLLLLGQRPAAGADPAPMSSGTTAICACADHDPACLDEAWPGGGPLLDQLAACAGQADGACSAEALIDLAALDQPACLPEGYARLLTDGGVALPVGRGVGLTWWSGAEIPADLSFCKEKRKFRLSPDQLDACRKAGLIGDTEDGGYPEIAEPGPDGGDGGSGDGPGDGGLEHGGQDTGG